MLSIALGVHSLGGQTFELPVIAGVSDAEGNVTPATPADDPAGRPPYLNERIEAPDHTVTDAEPAGQAADGQGLAAEGATRRGSSAVLGTGKRVDFNQDIYYRNKLETSVETGYLPANIPFVFDFLVNSPYTQWPLKYTLVPNIVSLRWHVDGIWGRSVFRGNTDFTFSGSFTAIPRGAETRYGVFIFGIRRNFVQPRWRVVPYFEGRGGVGNIDARGPMGVEYAQGQDLTFTLMMGSGARYNFNPRYSVSGGVAYMHISNLYLSEPAHENFGINVYGPMVGFNMRVGRARPSVRR